MLCETEEGWEAGGHGPRVRQTWDQSWPQAGGVSWAVGVDGRPQSGHSSGAGAWVKVDGGRVGPEWPVQAPALPLQALTYRPSWENLVGRGTKPGCRRLSPGYDDAVIPTLLPPCTEKGGPSRGWEQLKSPLYPAQSGLRSCVWGWGWAARLKAH